MANQKNKDILKRKNQDAVIYRAMIDMFIVIVALILLRLVDNSYSTPAGFDVWRGAFRWISLAGAAIAAAGVVLTLLKKAPKSSVWLLCGGAIIAVIGLLLFRYWVSPIPWLTFLTIAGGALYLVWLLYPNDFFLLAFLTTGCGSAFYLHGKGGLGLTVIALYCLMAVLLALSAWATRKAAQSNGIFRFANLRFRLFSVKGTPIPLYLCCAVWAACIAASLLIGSVFAYYCVYVAAGLLFVAACYYTIKLD